MPREGGDAGLTSPLSVLAQGEEGAGWTPEAVSVAGLKGIGAVTKVP